jgi:hypothetical protein
LLYINGVGNIPGFYDGQVLNYILFAGLTVFGFFIKNFNIKRIAIASVAAPSVYFLVSNFLVWASSSPLAGLGRPKTFAGLMMCYGDGLPFYLWSLAATLIFSIIFFGSYYMVKRPTSNTITVRK